MKPLVVACYSLIFLSTPALGFFIFGTLFTLGEMIAFCNPKLPPGDFKCASETRHFYETAPYALSGLGLSSGGLALGFVCFWKAKM